MSKKFRRIAYNMLLMSLPGILLVLIYHIASDKPVMWLPGSLIFLAVITMLSSMFDHDLVSKEQEITHRLENPRDIDDLVMWMGFTTQPYLASYFRDKTFVDEMSHFVTAIPNGEWIGVGDYIPLYDHTVIVWNQRRYTVPGKIERPPYESSRGKTMREMEKFNARRTTPSE